LHHKFTRPEIVAAAGKMQVRRVVRPDISAVFEIRDTNLVYIEVKEKKVRTNCHPRFAAQTGSAEGPVAHGAKNSEEAKSKQRSTGPTRNRLARPAASINAADRRAFDRLHAQLRREYKPAGKIEELIVERVALCWFRLEQAKGLEEKLIRAMTVPPVVSVMSEKLRLMLGCEAIALALPKEQPVSQEALEAALRTPGLAELVGKPPDTSPGLSVTDLNLLCRFQQYEAGVEAAFFRTLRELSRVQEAGLRQGGKMRNLAPRKLVKRPTPKPLQYVAVNRVSLRKGAPLRLMR
jgi:hypothetical protein